MNETTTQPTEADALASAKKGYAGRKNLAEASPAAAPAPAVNTEVALAEPTPPAVVEPPTNADSEPDPSAQPKPPSDAEQLKTHLNDLKAQVKQLKDNGADAKTVREMHGQIGEINATLKQLTKLQSEKAPESDELAEAIKDAELKAVEYPELGGSLLKLAKVLQAKLAALTPPEAAPPAPAAATPAAPAPATPDTQSGFTAAEEAAIKALDEAHPDRKTVKASAEFQEWFKTWKTPQYREKVNSSWNPVVVAEPFTDFKAWKAAKAAAVQTKKDRLEAAAQPRGTGATGQPTVLPDEAGKLRGYQRRKRAGSV